MVDAQVDTTSRREPARDEIGRFAGSKAEFGRARELEDAGYTEMPGGAHEQPNAKTFSGDHHGLSRAAEHLNAQRATPQATVTRQYLTEEGAEANDDEAVTLRRAADDLVQARANDAVEARRIERSQRTDRIDESSPADSPSLADEAAAEVQDVDQEAPPAEKETSETAEGGELDPRLQDALQHPQVRQAIEDRLGQAEAVRQNYVTALNQVSGLLRATVFAQFPELISDTPEQFQTAMASLAQRDPARYASARSLADRLSTIQSAQRLQQDQRRESERRDFLEYARAQDAHFDTMMKGESPQTKQRVANEVIAYADELGVPRDQFLELCRTERIMRNAAFQKMMYDAASYRLLQRARNEVGKKTVPQVQRPGSSVNARAALNEGELRALDARFARSPSVKNAADMLVAQRRRGSR